MGLASKSLARAKKRRRQITKRNRGISLGRMISEANAFLSGWVTYFRHAQCKRELRRLDQWLRQRLRCVRIKHGKRAKPLADFLERQGVATSQAYRAAASSKGGGVASLAAP